MSISPQILPLSFYQKEDVVAISKALLGKYIVTEVDGQYSSGKIVETEAYRGADDRACHAYPNKRTPRTATMYEPGGVAYVYLCYGIHHLCNLVVSPKDMANAVLIRAIEPADGLGIMLERRNMEKPAYRLTAGPGSLSSALGIQKNKHNGCDLTTREKIWIEDRGVKILDKHIEVSRRVGIASAGACAYRDWRFRIKNNPWTSKGKGIGE